MAEPAPERRQVHGTNPQLLIEKILRERIYESTYWKERLFGVSAETLVDRAVELRCIGGQFGNQRPTEFICIALKLLQLNPGTDIIELFLEDEDFKYLTALSAFYVRLTAPAVEVYRRLEPLLQDRRKLRRRTAAGGYDLTYMDEFVDELLTSDRSCDTILPRLTKRYVLEESGELEPRVSPIEDELESEEDGEVDGNQGETKAAKVENDVPDVKEAHDVDRDRRSRSRNRSRNRSREGDHKRDERNRSRERDHKRDDRDRSLERNRSHERQRDRRRSSRERRRSRSRSRRRNRSRSRSRSRDRTHHRRRHDSSRERYRDQRRDDRSLDRRDDRHNRKRDRSRSPDYTHDDSGSRKKHEWSKRKVDALFKKSSDKTKTSAASSAAGKNDSAPASGGGHSESLSVEETNRIRASLGLPPLRV